MNRRMEEYEVQTCGLSDGKDPISKEKSPTNLRGNAL